MSFEQNTPFRHEIVSTAPLPSIIENFEGLTEEEWSKRLLAWHAKETVEMVVPYADRLVSRQILADYSTYELPGVHTIYEEEGLDLLIHQSSLRGIFAIALQVATLSLIERMNRDKDATGQSPEGDLVHGGANSVFISMLTKGPGRAYFNDPITRVWNAPEAIIVYKHELLDRIDWYAYNSDEFGETSEHFMKKRPSPTEFFRSQWKKNNSLNEIVMPHGIPNEDIDVIVLQTQDAIRLMMQNLQDNNITQIGGRPLAEIFVTKAQFASDRNKSVE
jgi:hypothetical protein